MHPIIGITAGRTKNEHGQVITTITEAYLRAVIDAGGIPLVIPSTAGADGRQAVYSKLNGLVFSGGGDIAPERFGAAPHPRVTDVDSDRDALELEFLAWAAADGKPFLGICRGFQIMNVGLGGTLYTHLPDQLPAALQHDNPGNKRHELVHEVQLVQDSKIAEILGQRNLRVNSHHHQGAKDIAAKLSAVGTSPDGLVEAIELPTHPFGLAVQWHPEWLTNMEPTRRLFHDFVLAAGSQR